MIIIQYKGESLPLVMAVYLFPNRMIATFGYDNQQIPKLQGEYSQDLHEKIKRFSDGNTKWDGFE